MARHFPDWIKSYLEFVENTEPHDRYKKWSAISAISAVLKRKCHLQWHTKLYPNMYIVLVGPSGGRKTTAIDPMSDMLEEIGIQMSAQSVTREALIMDLAEATQNIVRPDGIYAHSSLTIVAKELVVFLGKDNLPFLSALCDWYDCHNNWEYRTKGSGVNHVVGVYVNLIGAITPSLLHEALPQNAIGGGLTSRMILVWAPGKGKRVEAPFLMPKDIAKQKLLIEDLMDMHSLEGRYQLTDEALTFWLKWYPAHDTKPPFQDNEKFAGYVERKPTHVLKLAMIYSASRGNSLEIDLCDFESAVEVINEAERVMANVYSGYGRRDSADLIPQITNLIASRKSIPRGELVGKFMTDLTTAQIDDIIRGLCEFGFCDQRVDPTYGIMIVCKEKTSIPNT